MFFDFSTRPENKISAAFMFGSYARTDHPADEYSDVDILMVVSCPEFFLRTDDWIKQVGEYHFSFIENSVVGEKARRVLFHKALEMDYIIISAHNAGKIFLNDHINLFFKKGFNTLVDKNGLSQLLSKNISEIKVQTFLTEPEFINLENDFWFHTVWSVKKLLRGELWAAKYCVDTYMKSLLLRLIEIRARIKNGIAYNTWHNGRFIDTWADEQVLSELKVAFSHYDKDDIIRALNVTIKLFQWISLEIAEKLDYKYPYIAEKSATEWMHKMIK